MVKKMDNSQLIASQLIKKSFEESLTDNNQTIRDKMLAEKDPQTGLPKFSLAVGFSLLIFYAFAMQCMSTLAIVRRETGGWRWPAFLFAYMTVLAYVTSFLVYQGGRLFGFG